jgi:hypothetical protein
MRIFFISLIVLTLASCSSYHSERNPTELLSTQWALMPVSNYSQSPQAGQQLEDLLESILFQRGVSLAQYPREAIPTELPTMASNTATTLQKAWLAEQDADYILSGSVQEWHYKTGLDGEPAVTVTLTLHKKSSNELIWSVTGARSGWGRESVGYAAHKVITTLLADLPLGE